MAPTPAGCNRVDSAPPLQTILALPNILEKLFFNKRCQPRSALGLLCGRSLAAGLGPCVMRCVILCGAGELAHRETRGPHMAQSHPCGPYPSSFLKVSWGT